MTVTKQDLYNYMQENYSIRDYKGYRQHRETYDVRILKNGRPIYQEQMRWVFLVTAFRKSENPLNDTCFVTKSDGSFEEVPIDSKDRITINGKKYSRKYWNH